MWTNIGDVERISILNRDAAKSFTQCDQLSEVSVCMCQHSVCGRLCKIFVFSFTEILNISM